MPAQYDVLAPYYDQLGMGNFARSMTHRLVDFAQRNGWMGRRIVVLGCGTGEGMEWLAQRGYVLSGIDQSPEMLALAQQRLSSTNMSITWLQNDIRTLSESDTMDLAIATDVFNELESLKDIEQAMQSIHQVLRAERWFIFDMHTIEGLIQRSSPEIELVADTDTLHVMTRNHFDYDRQVHEREYLIFERAEGDVWARRQAVRTLRAYPTQAIASLVQRCGFTIAHILKPDLTPYEPGKNGINRVIMLVTKR